MAVDGFMQGVVTQEALCVANGTAVDRGAARAAGSTHSARRGSAATAGHVRAAASRRSSPAGGGRRRTPRRSVRRRQRALPSLRGASAKRGLELGNVQSERCIPAPAHGLIGDFQVRLGLGQTATQRVEELPQVGVRLCVGGVGPEEKGELLSNCGASRCKSGSASSGKREARGMHPHQLRIVKREAETAKQPNMQCLHHPQQHVLVASSLPVCPCFRGDFCSNATS